MAYYQFDFTFVNLTALPAGASLMELYLVFSPAQYDSWYGVIPGSGDLTITTDTSAPDYGDPFELDATDKVWIEVSVLSDLTPPNQPDVLGLYLIGPYNVGDIGTEVPAP